MSDMKHALSVLSSLGSSLPLVGPLVKAVASRSTRRKKRSGKSTALVPYVPKIVGLRQTPGAVSAIRRQGARLRKAGLQRNGRTRNTPGGPMSQISIGPGGDSKQMSGFRSLCDQSMGQLNGSAGPVFSRQSMPRGQVSFAHAHLAQRETDRSFRNAVRILVTSVDGGSVVGSSGTKYLQLRSTGVGSGNDAPFSNGAVAPGSGTNHTVVFTPSHLSDDLAIFEQAFESYAIRYAKLRYVPTVGDYTTSAVNTNVSLGLTLLGNYDEYVGSGMDFGTLGNSERFVENHCTKPFEFDYCHTGSQTWNSWNSESENNDTYQGIIAGAWDQNIGATGVGQCYGHMSVFAIVDFYGLRPVVNAGSDPMVDQKAGLYDPAIKDEKRTSDPDKQTGSTRIGDPKTQPLLCRRLSTVKEPEDRLTSRFPSANETTDSGSDREYVLLQDLPRSRTKSEPPPMRGGPSSNVLDPLSGGSKILPQR